jgi:hypothetical protein
MKSQSKQKKYHRAPKSSQHMAFGGEARRAPFFKCFFSLRIHAE